MINIQILRFLAAFVVVLHHARASPLNLIAYKKLGLAWRFVADNGFWGVDIFFVISGAIMAHSIRDLSDDDQTALRFAVTRFARIFSGWWPFFVLYLAMYWFIGTLDQRNLVASFLLMPQSLDSSLLPITWTLSFELYFYLLLSALLLLPRRFVKSGLSVWASLVGVAVVYFSLTGLYTPAMFGKVTILHDFVFYPLVIEFAAGFMLHGYVTQGRRRDWWPWALLVLVFGVGGGYYQEVAALTHPSGLAAFFFAPHRVVLIGGVAVGLVGCTLLLPPAKGSLARLLAKLGDASYSIYLGHTLVIGAFAFVARKVAIVGTLPMLHYGVMLVSVLTYAWIHYTWIERPLYQRIRGIINARFAAKELSVG